MRIISIILLSCILISNSFGAAFEDIGSVRARGMGDAFESVSAGVDSVHYNPAGTAYLRSLQVFSEYGIPALGFDDDSSFNTLHFGASVPFSQKPYLIFLNYLLKGLTIGNESKIMQDGAFSFIFHHFSVSDFWHENLFTINIAKNLNNLLEGANLAAGININIFNFGYEMTEDMTLHPDSPAESTTSLGIDFGMTYDFSKDIRLSFVLLNLLPPNISVFDDGVAENVSQQLKLGIAWKFGDISFMKDFLASICMVQITRDSAPKNDDRSNEGIYKGGVEFWPWKKRLGFRLGYKTLLNVMSSGLTYKHNLKNGHNVMVNYAFNYPINSENVKNYFSLSYEFDFPDFYFDYRTDNVIRDKNKEIEENFKKGMVIIKYETMPNDNLYNISLIHYGTPGQAELLKKHNKIEDEQDLPSKMEVPYDAKSFITYKVEPGDTLDSIAMKLYNTLDKIEKIRRFNDIQFSRLWVGRVLIIPMSKKDKEAFDEYEKNRMEEARKEQERKEKERIEKEKKAKEVKKDEEAGKKAEEDKKKGEESKKKAEEDKKKGEESKKKAEEDKKKGEEDKKKAEEDRKKGEEDKKKAEEDKKKKEEGAGKPAVPGTSGTTAVAEEQIHVIAAGENLGTICKKYYGSSSFKLVLKLAKYNNIDANKIRLGMKLKIPDKSLLK